MRAVFLTTILFALTSAGYAFSKPNFQCRMTSEGGISSTILVFDEAIAEIFDDGTATEFICTGKVCLDTYRDMDNESKQIVEIEVLSLNYVEGIEFPATADTAMMQIWLKPFDTVKKFIRKETLTITDCRK